MEMTLIYTVIGFALAGYSVIANDSIQTLGTFIASKKKWFKWYVLAGSASAVMILALGWGWYSFNKSKRISIEYLLSRIRSCRMDYRWIYQQR